MNVLCQDMEGDYAANEEMITVAASFILGWLSFALLKKVAAGGRVRARMDPHKKAACDKDPGADKASKSGDPAADLPGIPEKLGAENIRRLTLGDAGFAADSRQVPCAASLPLLSSAAGTDGGLRTEAPLAAAS